MDLSCTQDADAGEGEEDGDGEGEDNLPLPQATPTTTLGPQNGLTQEALESFSMEESLPHSAMDTQTSKGAADEDRLSYVTDENEGENVPLTQEDPPALTLPLVSAHFSGRSWGLLTPVTVQRCWRLAASSSG